MTLDFWTDLKARNFMCIGHFLSKNKSQNGTLSVFGLQEKIEIVLICKKVLFLLPQFNDTHHN